MYNLKFGTDGLRGRIGTPPFTQPDFITFANALAAWAAEKYDHPVRILIAQDPRNSSDWLNSLLKSGLLQLNADVHDAGILPTPAVCALLKYTKQYDFGIMITASHNEYGDNGIKILDGDGSKINVMDEQRIEILFSHQITGASNHFGKIIHAHRASVQNYEQYIKSFFPVDFLKGISIALDCANGAASTVASHIFHSLGAILYPINVTPDGFNINAQCGSLHPQRLQEEIIKTNANVGFAFDGDGDRLTVVTQKGLVKNGDDVLALLSQHPIYKNSQQVVGTIMSNQGLAHYLHQQDKVFHRSAVGDKMVADMMVQQNALFGGEPSGHILAADYILNSDGIFAALRVVETVMQTNNWDFETFEKFPQFTSNIPVKEKKDIYCAELAPLIQEYESSLQPGRLLIRYSGTEPLLRVMVEHQDSSQADFVIKKLDSILRKYLS